MSRLQTLRMIACMLLMGVVAIAAYLFYQHSLYFCLFFSLMIMAGIIIYICQWQYKTTRMISRMIEGIRYADFSLSFSTQHKTRTEQRLAQEIIMLLLNSVLGCPRMKSDINIMKHY